MTVYVDELHSYPCLAPSRSRAARHFGNGKSSCHLTAGACSPEGVAELHALAGRIGLEPAWFQSGSWPHYDLTPAVRRRALAVGAVEETAREGGARRMAERSRGHGAVLILAALLALARRTT